MANNSPDTPPRKKRTKWDNHFKSDWTAQFSFMKASRRGDTSAFCETCRADFSISHGGINDVNKHIATAKHTTNTKALKNQKTLMQMLPKATNTVIRSETLFQGFVIEHNLPLTINDHFTKLAPKMFPDSKIAKDYACGRTKATHITYQLASDTLDKFKTEVGHGNKMYSFATDGSSDEEDKFFPVLVTHEDTDTGLIKTSFLDMPTINQATGENITNIMLQSLEEAGLHINECLAFSCDNASVMTGRHKGVLGLLHEKNPHIYGMGCPCHLSALSAKEGGKALKGFNPEDFLIDLYFHFDKSSKRKENLRDLLGFCNTETRKVLKHVSTRWLSLHKCLERTLKLWDGLKSYFLTNFYDEEVTKRGEKSKAKGGPREQRLVKVFLDPTAKLYIHFLHAVLPNFDQFNTILQTEAPMIHALYPSMVKLFKNLMSSLILPSSIPDDNDQLFSVDLEDSDIQRTDNELFIGFSAMQMIRKDELQGTAGVTRFMSEARHFYINAMKYIQKKFPVNDILIKNAVAIDPKQRSSSSVQSILALVDVLPENVVPLSSRDNLLREFCQFQCASDLELPDMDDRVDQFWQDASLISDPSSDSKQYPTLCRLAKHILLVPHSNAFCESLFSIVKKVTTDTRSQLGRGKEGHSKDSVYADVHNVRNTLCGIIATKINLFKRETCHTWKPSDSLLIKAKSATYRALNRPSATTKST